MTVSALKSARLLVLVLLGATLCISHAQVEARSLINYVPEAANLLHQLGSELYEQMQAAATRGFEVASSVFRDQSDGEQEDPDTHRNVSEIIRSRGFVAEEHDVITKDGYILTVQRIVNPLVAAEYKPKMKPVILQHGLMSSSVDWVINTLEIEPRPYPRPAAASTTTSADTDSNSIESHLSHAAELNQGSSQRLLVPTAPSQSIDEPNALGFYLANLGYDVFLANSRGNVYGQRHVNLSSWNPQFWAFTFDEQIKYDLPATIAYIQKLTTHTKIAYVGHSQGTTMAMGLLADQPDYADTLEPVALLAPVAYVNHCTSPAKYFSFYTPMFEHVNWGFGSSNAVVRHLGPKVCGPQWMRRKVCANIVFLSTGFDEAEFNETRAPAYLAHMPSGTSVKNLAHWGQEVLSGKFSHFDHGMLNNLRLYGSRQPPEYDVSKIRSKSLILFVAENDWLASPKDVARLRRELTVKPIKVYNLTEDVPKWNHIDFTYGIDSGRLVNKRIVDIFQRFRDTTSSEVDETSTAE